MIDNTRSERRYLRLPAEILHLILSYYTTDFRRVVHFSTICKEWKEVANHSPVWLQKQLIFHSPIAYFGLTMPLNRIELERDQVERLRLEVGTRWPLIIALSQSSDCQYPSNKFKIIVNTDTTTTTTRDTINPITNEREVDGKENGHPLERANEIRVMFMRIFVQFHRYWFWYIENHWIFDRILQVFPHWRVALLAYIAVLSCVVCLPIACYLLSDIVNYSDSLSWKNEWGFVCIYACSFFLLLSLLSITLNTIAAVVTLAPKLDYWNTKKRADILFLIILLLMLIGVILTVILLHYKLSTRDSSFLYLFLTLPLWLFAGFATPVGKTLGREMVQYVRQLPAWFIISSFTGSLLSIPLGFTFITWRYDFPSGAPSIAIALLPFYPLACLLYVVTVYSLADNLKEANTVSRQLRTNRGIAPYCKLSFAFLRSLCCIGMMIIVVAFTLISTLGSYSLSYGIMFAITFVACFVLSIAAHIQTMTFSNSP